MAAGFSKTPEEDAFAARLSDMSARLARLETAQPTIPVLDADPLPTSDIKLWFLYDGRMRSRVNGVVREYATMTAGSGTSGVLKPVTASPVQRRDVFDATWFGTYDAASRIETSSASVSQFQPTYGSTAGTIGAFGFGAAVASALVGKQVQRAELRFVPLLTDGSGQESLVPLYGHSDAARPAAGTDALGAAYQATLSARTASSAANPVSAYRKTLDDRWQVLDRWFYERLVTGEVAAFAVDPTAFGSAAVGQVASSGNTFAQTPQLRVTYIG